MDLHPHLPRLLEVHEVAFLMKCSQETVRRLIRRGELIGVRFGNQWRVDPVDLQAYIESQKVRIAAHERVIDQQFAAASSNVNVTVFGRTDLDVVATEGGKATVEHRR